MIDDDIVKIFGNDFDTLRILGNSLASKTSHKIMHLLQHEEMYANEISKKLGISLNLISFHLTKLEKIGVVKVTHHRLVKNGSEHKYYKMMPNIFISIFETKKEIHETGFLRRFFRDGIKFAAIGVASSLSWAFIKFNETTTVTTSSSGYSPSSEPLTIPLLIIIFGLIIILFKKKG